MKYSILIPSYDPELKRFDMVLDLIKSVEMNSVGKDYEIILRKNGRSYTDSHNDALKSATGDHIVVLNDDVLIQDPQWLEKLAIPDCISSWRLAEFGLTGEAVPDFACWSMSREVFEKIGLLDETYRDGINFEDNDYAYRAKELGIGFHNSGVQLIHYGNQSLHSQHHDYRARIEANERIFRTKWKPQTK